MESCAGDQKISQRTVNPKRGLKIKMRRWDTGHKWHWSTKEDNDWLADWKWREVISVSKLFISYSYPVCLYCILSMLNNAFMQQNVKFDLNPWVDWATGGTFIVWVRVLHHKRVEWEWIAMVSLFWSSGLFPDSCVLSPSPSLSAMSWLIWQVIDLPSGLRYDSLIS